MLREDKPDTALSPIYQTKEYLHFLLGSSNFYTSNLFLCQNIDLIKQSMPADASSPQLANSLPLVFKYYYISNPQCASEQKAVCANFCRIFSAFDLSSTKEPKSCERSLPSHWALVSSLIKLRSTSFPPLKFYESTWLTKQ